MNQMGCVGKLFFWRAVRRDAAREENGSRGGVEARGKKKGGPEKPVLSLSKEPDGAKAWKRGRRLTKW